ncbi:hypothetical protein E1B28_003291 [Marasmius oreades]|uniref:Uncharacterized protein n=1 Tax=Marasmius oreades TaxID=181124 RepID=A0A9P7RM97_9AGAR|nr:uncharacterized protein E1B28_003291 [Marasmius oreades]KAG7085748.1 hypothetical protein E1B28_003291 [Marasmius oreades]
MDLQFDFKEATLSFKSIVAAGRSVSFFDRLSPCNRCTYFGYADCRPIWAPSGKTGRRPTCQRCFSGKQKCLYFDSNDSRTGAKKIEIALSNNILLAKIVHCLQREFKAFDQARRAQIAAYDSGRLIWQDIQESQRLLRAAGRDPVEVLKGLQDDEDFKMTADQVKALGEVLGWPIASSSAPVVTDNLHSPPIEDETEESAPLQSTEPLPSLPEEILVPVAAPAPELEVPGEAEEEQDQSSPSKPSVEPAEPMGAMLIDDEAEEARTDHDSSADEGDIEVPTNLSKRRMKRKLFWAKMPQEGQAPKEGDLNKDFYGIDFLQLL